MSDIGIAEFMHLVIGDRISKQLREAEVCYICARVLRDPEFTVGHVVKGCELPVQLNLGQMRDTPHGHFQRDYSVNTNVWLWLHLAHGSRVVGRTVLPYPPGRAALLNPQIRTQRIVVENSVCAEHLDPEIFERRRKQTDPKYQTNSAYVASLNDEDLPASKPFTPGRAAAALDLAFRRRR